MRVCKTTWLILSAILLTQFRLSAQSDARSTILGRVTDPAGGAIGAAVRAESMQTRFDKIYGCHRPPAPSAKSVQDFADMGSDAAIAVISAKISLNAIRKMHLRTLLVILLLRY